MKKQKMSKKREKALLNQPYSEMKKAIRQQRCTRDRRIRRDTARRMRLQPAAFTRHMATPLYTAPPYRPRNFTPQPSFRNNIRTALKRAPQGKATGRDGINSERLQRVAENEIVDLLTAIWEVCGRFKILPRDWEEGILIPTQKKGDHSQPANHRPLCLLEHMRKIIKTATRYALLEHITFHKMKIGFQPFLRTEMAIAQAIAEIRKRNN